MKRFLTVAFSILTGLMLLLAGGIYCIDAVCFDEAFYFEQYRRLNTADSIGMSQEDLDKTTEKLLGYLKDEEKDLSVQAEIGGKTREVFNQKEKEHMVDVKALYLGTMSVAYGCTIGAMILIVIELLVTRTKRMRQMLSGYLWSNGILLALVGTIGVYMMVDFNSFWTNFHHVFFTNDLWLLDPTTDVLIMMYPGEFFSALVGKIAWIYGSCMLAVFIGVLAGYIYLKRKDKKSKK